MRGFFWILIAIYIFLYFYAVYLYEEFSVWLIIALFVAIAVSFWVYKNKGALSKQVHHVEVEAKPLSLWQSPFPYIGIGFCAFMLWFLLL